MSAPCFARMIAEDRIGHMVAVSQHGSLPDSMLLGHEPVVPLSSNGVVGIHPTDPWVDGIHMMWKICKHCHALVLIPVSELPR